MSMEEIRPFRWCFIGSGRLGRQVAEEISGSRRHQIVTCYSRNKETAQTFADKYGTRICSSAEEAIAAEDVDGVYVVTPHNAHYRFVRTALELKKPVLCEKAFTVNADEAEKLIGLSEKNNVYLCEAMWTWFAPGPWKVKEWVENGEIGRVTGAGISYCGNGRNYAPRVINPTQAGGALLDVGVYAITFAYRLWGIPEKIESSARIADGIDWGDHLIFTYPGGMQVEIMAAIDAVVGDEKAVITGETGTICMPNFHWSGSANCEKNDGTAISCSYPNDDYLTEFDAAAEDIRSGRLESTKVPLRATLDVMRIMDTVREQIGLRYDHLE